MKVEDLTIDIYADGADLEGMLEMKKLPYIKGFTTNPTLMKKAGVKDYVDFAENVLKEINDLPVSFEVFSDDVQTMEKEARKLASLSNNVYVKIPVMNTKCEPTYDLIHRLSEAGLHLNVTAIFTLEQVAQVTDALSGKEDSIVSVFFGRIADAGVDARAYARAAAALCGRKDHIRLLWASCREIYNIVEAQEAGSDIITVPNDILKKTNNLGKDLFEFSRETVQMFSDDSEKLGYTIL